MSSVASALSPPPSGADPTMAAAMGVSQNAVAPEPEKKPAEKISSQSIFSEGEKDIKEDLSKLSSLKPPSPPQFKEAPKFETSDPAGQGYAAAIGLMGAIGSMFTRRPMIASMNTAAAVVSAMKQGDQDTFKQKLETWKLDNDNIKALSDYQQKIYEDIFKNTKLDLETKVGMLTAQAAAFKDDAMAQHMKNSDMHSAEQLNLDREKAMHTWEKEAAEAEKLITENNARNEQMKLLHEEFKAGQITKEQLMNGLQGIATNKVTGMAPTLSSDTIDFLAHQALSGDKSVYTNMGRQSSGAANVAAIRERVNELAEEQGISPEELARRGQQFAGDTSGQRTLSNRVAAISAAHSAIGHVPTKDNPGSGAAKLAVDASNKVSRGKFVPLTESMYYARDKLSDPDLRQLTVYTNTLVNEYSNATNPTGKGTVADRNHGWELISRAISKEAYKATVEAMVNEADNSHAMAKKAKKEFLGDAADNEDGGKSYSKPSEEHIERLRTNPGEVELFDEIYGPGAAQKILDEQ